MNVPMNELHGPDPAVDVAKRVRLVIKALAAAKEMSIKGLSEKAGLVYNTFREHLNGESGGVSLIELQRIAPVLGISMTDLVEIAETGQGFTIPAQCEPFELIDGTGTSDGLQGRLNHLHTVV